VNVQPARRRSIGADLDQVEIGVAVTRVDGAKVIGIAGVAAEVERMLRTFDDPGRPQRRVVLSFASGIVSRRRAIDLHALQLDGLPPIHLMDLRGRNLPAFEMCADAEPHVELRALLRQVLNRRHVQVIVVIVRDQHGIDAREVRELDRRRVHALRPDR
jgi:hypothetical protein